MVCGVSLLSYEIDKYENTKFPKILMRGFKVPRKAKLAIFPTKGKVNFMK